MISKEAIQEFLQRPLFDSRGVKEFDEARLDRGLARLGAQWKTEPRFAQKVGLYLGLRFNSWEFIYDPGTGKSKMALDLIRSRGYRGLVLVPFSTNLDAWKEECEIHAPDFRVGLIKGSRPAREFELTNLLNDVVVCTYAGFLSLVCDRGEKGKKRTRGLIPNPKKLKRLGEHFGVIVGDESSHLRSGGTTIFRVLRTMTDLVPHLYLLSGTPLNSPEDLWSQFFLMDRGATLGATLGLFREAMFDERPRYWGGSTFTLKPSMKDELSRRLWNRATRYTADECIDLPPTNGGLLSERYMIRRAEWSEEGWSFYEKLLLQMEAQRENPEERENLFIRLRQATSGYLPVRDELGVETLISFAENPKMELLLELLAELDPRRKIIVYNHYRLTGDAIERRLAREKIPCARIYSKTRDKTGVVARWKQDPEARVLLGSLSIVYGLNLQRMCNYMAVFESPTPPLERIQLEKRISRDGQRDPTFVWDLAMENSVDLRILRSLRKGQDLIESLYKTPDALKEAVDGL